MRCRDIGFIWLTCAILVGTAVVAAANSAPEVSNVRAEQRLGTTLVDIYYDVYDADGDVMTVTAFCLDGAGGAGPIASTQQGSDIGPGILSEQGKHIVWDAGIDMPGRAGDTYAVRVTACDTSDELQMVYVPAGTFVMGDGVAYCGVDQRWVTLTHDFYLGQHEVTNQEYLEALQWARDNGYVTATTTSVRDNLDGSTQELLDLNDSDCEIQFESGTGTFYLRESPSSNAQNAYPGGYDPADHPVKEVTWYGAVRYCDWLSLRAGLPRAYQHSGDWSCNGGDPYGASGYRLPTDAEREYAAQHNDDRIYPWGGESPDCSRANFYNGYYCVRWTSPVGSYPDAPAPLGLSDMAGNLWEWCNDWHVCNLGTETISDPVGETSGISRVLRGGSWGSFPSALLRCAYRHGHTPDYSDDGVGLRVARTVNP